MALDRDWQSYARRCAGRDDNLTKPQTHMKRPSEMEISELIQCFDLAARHVAASAHETKPEDTAAALVAAAKRAQYAAELIAGHLETMGRPTGFCDACGQYNFQH